jgi:hypothetical protein
LKRSFENYFVLLFVILFGISSVAVAQELPQNELQVNINSYFDNFGVRVIYPEVSVQKSVSNSTSFNGRILADVITAASMKCHFDSVYSFQNVKQGIDAYTSASNRKTGGSYHIPDEFRGEFGLGLTQMFGEIALSLNNLYSIEHDYSSETVTGSLTIPLAKKNTTMQLGIVKSWDKNYPQTRVWTAKKDVLSSSFTMSQILGTGFIAQLELFYSNMNGFLSDPYQVVTIFNIDSNFLKRYETIEPNTRNRAAAGIRGIYRLSDMSSLELGYRYYTDDWDIKSHTISGLFKQMFDNGKMIIGIGNRTYFQTKASFFKDIYTVEENYMTVDPKLNGLLSNEIELNLTMNGDLLPIINDDNVEMSARLQYYIRKTNSPDWLSRYNILNAYLFSLGFRYLFN